MHENFREEFAEMVDTRNFQIIFLSVPHEMCQTYHVFSEGLG
jgi:hypothetical protein